MPYRPYPAHGRGGRGGHSTSFNNDGANANSDISSARYENLSWRRGGGRGRRARGHPPHGPHPPSRNHSVEEDAGGTRQRGSNPADDDAARNRVLPVVLQVSMMSRAAELELLGAARAVFDRQTLLVVSATDVAEGAPNAHSLHPRTTHLVLPSSRREVAPARTEKLLSAIADGGVWILSDLWLRESIREQKLVAEAPHDLGVDSVTGSGRKFFGLTKAGDELFVANKLDRKNLKDKGGVFREWTTVVITRTNGQGQNVRDSLNRVLKRGGANVFTWTLQHLADGGESCLRQLTHIFVDPTLILDPKFKKLYNFLWTGVKNGRRIALLSLTFVEELLTSRVTPASTLFAALNKRVIQMHIEQGLVEKTLTPHAPLVMGSPCLSIRPSHVRHRLKLRNRCDAPRVPSSVKTERNSVARPGSAFPTPSPHVDDDYSPPDDSGFGVPDNGEDGETKAVPKMEVKEEPHPVEAILIELDDSDDEDYMPNPNLGNLHAVSRDVKAGIKSEARVKEEGDMKDRFRQLKRLALELRKKNTSVDNQSESEVGIAPSVNAVRKETGHTENLVDRIMRNVVPGPAHLNLASKSQSLPPVPPLVSIAEPVQEPPSPAFQMIGLDGIYSSSDEEDDAQLVRTQGQDDDRDVIVLD